MSKKRWIKGMRDAFFDALYELANESRKIILLAADTGAICHDDFKKDLPLQYLNVGIAEQNMIGIAAGLAMLNKVVYCYAIIPFITMRCYEQIRVDLCCMNLNVNLIGVGAGFDYSTLGPTHHATEDINLMRGLPGMKIYSPSDSMMVKSLVQFINKEKGPKYIRLDRTGVPIIYGKNQKFDFSKGLYQLIDGRDLLVISTGRMVFKSLDIIKILRKKYGISAALIDLFRIKPLNRGLLKRILVKYNKIVTLEEHFLTGGIGSSILEFINEEDIDIDCLRIGLKDEFCRFYGNREYLLGKYGITSDNISDKICNWLNDL